MEKNPRVRLRGTFRCLQLVGAKRKIIGQTIAVMLEAKKNKSPVRYLLYLQHQSILYALFHIIVCRSSWWPALFVISNTFLHVKKRILQSFFLPYICGKMFSIVTIISFIKTIRISTTFLIFWIQLNLVLVFFSVYDWSANKSGSFVFPCPYLHLNVYFACVKDTELEFTVSHKTGYIWTSKNLHKYKLLLLFVYVLCNILSL